MKDDKIIELKVQILNDNVTFLDEVVNTMNEQ